MKPKSSLPFVIILLFLSLSATAQKKHPDKPVAHLYETDYDAVDDKIFREHIPLDGDSVRFIPFRKDKLYGFVDKKTRKWVIEPKFTQVYAVYKEGAIVEVQDEARHIDGYGLVGYDGKFIIGPGFANLYKEGNVYHGLLDAVDTTMAEMYDRFVANYYFDEQGKFLFECKAHRFATFIEGDSLAWFRYGTDYSVYNRAGKLVKQFKYDSSKSFLGIYRNLLVEGIKKGDEYLYRGYDVQGKQQFEVLSGEYANAVFRMSDDVFGFVSEDGFFMTDKTGKPFSYGISNGWYGNGFRYIFPYLEKMELIPVQDFETKKTGYISRSGQLVIPCSYYFAGSFQSGEAPYFDTAKRMIGFMNTKEETVVSPFLPMDNIYELQLTGQGLFFSEGLCRAPVVVPVTNEEGEQIIMTGENGRPKARMAYFDRKGVRQLLLPDSIIMAGNFEGGLAMVVAEGGALGFIDTTGKIVIPMKYEIAMAGAYPFPQLVLPEFNHGFVYLKAFKGYLDKKGNEYFSGKQEKDEYDFSH